MKSNTKIEKQLRKKRNPELVETIIAAKKQEKWKEIASLISTPKRKRIEFNINEIDKFAEGGEILVIPGKVLSMGDIDKKIKIVALSFSKKAREKLKGAGCEIFTLLEEIKKNPHGKEIRILK